MGEKTGPALPEPGSRVSLGSYLICLAILVIALYPRLWNFEAVFESALEEDAASFYGQAVKPVSLFGAGEREPFFLLLHRGALLMFHHQRWAIRLQSLVFSLMLVGLVTGIGFRLFREKVAAAISGLILALTPYMAYQAGRGLRLELFVSLTLGLAALLFLPKAPLRIRNLVLAGVLAAAVCLTRQVGLMICGAIFIIALVKLGKKHGFKTAAQKLALAAAIALALTLPHYISQHRERGTAFYESVRDATFWKNQEFRDRPGHFSSAELARNPYRGEAVTPFEYMFGMHGFFEVTARVARGYRVLFTFYFFHTLGRWWWLMLLAAPGAIALTLRNQWEWIILFALLVLPFSFILTLSVAGQTSVDNRFAMYGYPLFCLLVGAGLDAVLGRARAGWHQPAARKEEL